MPSERPEIMDLRREKRSRSVNKSQERTLEMVFSRGNRHPSFKLIQEICDLEGLRRPVVIEWFANRRTQAAPDSPDESADFDEWK
jgi:hypothetical protein